MTHPAFSNSLELPATNESEDCLFEGHFSDHLGNPRNVFFYSRDFDTAERDLRVVSSTFDPAKISQHVMSVDSSKITKEEYRKRIIAAGGVITDEAAFDASFRTSERLR